jgi:hypothetical protein
MNTRGRPFEPGNAGKPRGARNRTTVMAERLMEDDAEAVSRRVIDEAKAGDMTAARLVLERIAPPRRARVRFDLPKVETVADLPKAITALLAAMAAGQIAPEEGSAIASSISLQCRVLETSELEARIAELERARAGQ